MKTVRTRYEPWGEIVASDGQGAIMGYIPLSYMSDDENHAAAADLLVKREGWHCSSLVMGWYGHEVYHVMLDGYNLRAVA